MIGISILTLATVFCLFYLIKYFIWLFRAINMTANIPGPKPLPIIGNALIFAKATTSEEVVKTILSLFNDHSDGIIKLWLGPKPIIFLANPKHIEIVLNSQDAIEKDDSYNRLGLLGNGVFVRNGQEWQELRKPLDKFLTKKMRESNLDVFHEKALKLWNMLNKYADTRAVINLREYLTNYTFDVLCKVFSVIACFNEVISNKHTNTSMKYVSSFGHDLNAIENEQYNLFGTLNCLEEILLKIMLRVPYSISMQYTKLSMTGRRFKKLSQIFWNLTHQLLKGRLKNKKQLEDENDPSPSFYSDVLLQKVSRDKLSWEDTGRLVTDYLIAGFNTSATTLSYILLILAMYPEHQEAVYQEQIDICGDDPEVTPTCEQLSKMNYLTRVVKEVWRLYGTIGIARKLTNDINLGEYKIPKGFAAFIMLNILHRNPKIWLHPNEFYPDHFLPEEIAKRPKGSFLPFSLGPRGCPGSVYAMISIKTLVSVAVRKYKFETDLLFEKLEYKYRLLIEPSQTYLVRIKKRK